MSLDKLEYILAVAEEQTLTRAAKKLYISQPALTNYINKLEEELGVKLFDRSVTPVHVTRAGALYIERMKRIRRDSDSLINELKQMSGQQTVFKLGIGTCRGSHWLPYIIPEFCANHPDITLQLHENGEDYLEKGVLEGDIDMAIGVLNTNYPEMKYEEIVAEEVYLAIPREYSCVSHLSPGEGTPENPYHITAEEVGTISMLMPYTGSGFYRCATMLMDKAGMRPGRIVNYSNMNTAYQLATKGVGAIFITPAFFLRVFPQQQQNLAFCTLQDPPYVRRSVVGFRPDNPKIKYVHEIVDLIRERLLPELE